MLCFFLEITVEWSVEFRSASNMETNGCFLEWVYIYYPFSPFFLLLFFVFVFVFVTIIVYCFNFFMWILGFWDSAKTGDNVLDVCCGSGDLSFLLSEQVGSQGKVSLLWQSFISLNPLVETEMPYIKTRVFFSSELCILHILVYSIITFWFIFSGSWFSGDRSWFLQEPTVNGFISARLSFKGLLQEYRVSIGKSSC